jgi:Mor family transcriptional regulator
MQGWTKYITKADLPNVELKLVADIIGMETTINLMEELAGTFINFPKTALNKCRNQFICEEYDGSKESRMALAKKFGVTERYIIKVASYYRKKAS